MKLEIGIGRDQDREAFTFSGVEQLSVLQMRPPTLERRGDFMLPKRLAQGRRGTLVEENAHLGGSQGAPLCVVQYRAYLFEGHAGEPLDEL